MGLVRVILAVAVLVTHTKPLFGLAFFGGGVTAVECFFVISGFYMALVLTGKYTRTSDFYFNRAIRVFPLYYAVLAIFILTAVPYGLATGRWLGCMSMADEAPLSLASAAVLANVTIFGSDLLHFVPMEPDKTAAELLAIPVVWSLAVELTFYGIAPFLNRLSTKWLIAVAAASMGLRVWLTASAGAWTPWTYFFAPSQLWFFALGMLAFRYYGTFVKDRPLRKKAVGSLLAAWCTLACVYANIGLQFEQRWVIEVPFLMLLPYVFQLTKDSHTDRALAAWSYPIYLIHSLLLAIYSPLRHFVPEELFSFTVLSLTLAGSAVAVRFDSCVDRRLKRQSRPERGRAVPQLKVRKQAEEQVPAVGSES